MTKTNRIKVKANRNLYWDQVVFISAKAKELKISDSELLRRLVDAYIKQETKGEKKSGV